MQAQEMIKSWTKEKGLKFSWVAAQVPVKPPAMSRWMNGNHIPSAPCRVRLSEITGIDVRDANMWVK